MPFFSTGDFNGLKSPICLYRLQLPCLFCFFASAQTFKLTSLLFMLTRKTVIALLFTLPIAGLMSFAQPVPKWRRLPGGPTGTARIDDGWFVNPRVGWVANGRGEIWRTLDGGGNWIRQFRKDSLYFRCITFADSLRGWAANVGTEDINLFSADTNIIYRTTNGGATWFVGDNFIGIKPRGICGIQAVGDSFVYGVGRVRGPARFVRSSDGGVSWQVRDMSSYASGLMDLYFWNADSGIAVGHSGPLNETSYGRILFTSDRGTTWTIRHTTTRIGEWCWKVSFPSRSIGYVSLQRNSGSPTYFVKTTDGGATWQDKLLTNSNYYVQGIGFATETRGWVGGNSASTSLGTTNGGNTWFVDTIGYRLNRFRILNDSIGYATGQGVFKYSVAAVTGVVQEPTDASTSQSYVLLNAYPNPFNPHTMIEYAITSAAEDPVTPMYVRVTLHDLLGREIVTLVNELKTSGTYRVVFDGSRLASGIYFAKAEARTYDNAPLVKGSYAAMKKLLLVR